MKTALIISAVISIGSAVSAFTWVPEAADGVRNYVSDPLRNEIKVMRNEIRSNIASAKHWDMQTDYLSDTE